MCLSVNPAASPSLIVFLLSDSTYEDSLMQQQEDTPDVTISDEEQEDLGQQLGHGPSRGLDGRDGNNPRPVFEPPALAPSPPPLGASTPPPVASSAPSVTTSANLGVSATSVASSGVSPAILSQAASTGLAAAASASSNLVTGPGPASGSLFGAQPPPAVASQAAPIQVRSALF